ncbi:MAG TPA: aminodeoxychorismate lyase [Bacilli bacterium]
MKISVNGILCDENEAVVSVYDHGFLYGIGLFETFRTYKGRPFLLKEHLDRLMGGCRELGIDFEAAPGQVEQTILALLNANRLTDAYIRYTVSAGRQPLGLPSGDYDQPSVIVYMKELPSYHADLYEVGKPLQRLRIRRNTPEGTVRLKSIHYMNNILAKRELLTYPWAQEAEGLFLTESAHLAEGIVSNLFYMNKGMGYTPAVSTGILPGVTRAFVLKLAAQAGMEVVEGHYEWQDLLDADEIFLTNSIQGLVPVCRLFDEQGASWQVGDGQAGVHTRQLMELYRQAARN